VIKAYYRPKTIQEALDLLSKEDQEMIPLGGGTRISQIQDQEVSVVDLQALDLNQIMIQGNLLKIGSTVTLQAFSDFPGLSEHLRRAIDNEANFNLRQKATLAGSIVSGDGRSTLLTALLALGGSLSWLPGPISQGIGEFLLTRDTDWPGKLIEYVTIPLSAKILFSSIGRSPADLPIVCASVAVWPTGRVRIALGGFGLYPVLAMDAPDSGDAEFAVRDALAYSQDAWASKEYRQDAAVILVKRMLVEI